MTGKSIIRRVEARRDIIGAVDYYLSEASEVTANRFIEALEHAFESIAHAPGAGSLRYSYTLGLDGLRFWPIRRFPYLIFYLERDDHIDVWRVLHGSRNIAALLAEQDDAGSDEAGMQ